MKAKRKSLQRAGLVELLGRQVPIVQTEDGLRALAKSVAIEPAAVELYLEAKFKEPLPVFLAAMQTLAASRAPTAIAVDAYRLYEACRPAIPAGEAGWGQAGAISLEAVDALAQKTAIE